MTIETRHHRADRHVQRVCGLAIAQLLHINQQHDEAEGVRQAVKRRLDEVAVSVSGVGGSNSSADSVAVSRLVTTGRRD